MDHGPLTLEEDITVNQCFMVTRVKSSSVAAVAFRWDVVAVDVGHQLVLRRSAVVHSGDGTVGHCISSRAVHRVCDGRCCHCAVCVAGITQFIHSVQDGPKKLAPVFVSLNFTKY